MMSSAETQKPTGANRRRKFRVHTVTVLLLTLGIVIVLNYLGTQYHKRRDFTRFEFYSLSPQTEKALKQLRHDLRATYFYKDNAADDYAVDLLQEYDQLSPRFVLNLVDLDKRPALAKRMDVNDYETLVLQYKDRFAKLVSPEEKEITNAMVRLYKGRKKKIYFTAGHGERSFSDYDRSGYSEMTEAIRGLNTEIMILNTVSVEAVPADCDLLVINGTTRQWTPREISLVRNYLGEKGRLFLNLDEDPQNLAASLLEKWDVALRHETVVDPTSSIFGAGPGITVLPGYPFHKITKNFRLMTAFEMPKGIQADSMQTDHDYEVSPLLMSGPQSWGEADSVDENTNYNPEKDLAGPLIIGSAIRSTDKNQKERIVLVGDADYASNAYSRFAGNRDLYLNILAWLLEEEDLISIRTKEFSYQRIDATGRQAGFYFVTAVLFIPFSLLAAGIIVWFRRRK